MMPRGSCASSDATAALADCASREPLPWLSATLEKMRAAASMRGEPRISAMRASAEAAAAALRLRFKVLCLARGQHFINLVLIMLAL